MGVRVGRKEGAQDLKGKRINSSGKGRNLNVVLKLHVFGNGDAKDRKG